MLLVPRTMNKKAMNWSERVVINLNASLEKENQLFYMSLGVLWEKFLLIALSEPNTIS